MTTPWKSALEAEPNPIGSKAFQNSIFFSFLAFDVEKSVKGTVATKSRSLVEKKIGL